MSKFYTNNKEVFQRYFDHSFLSNGEFYDALVGAKNFKKLAEIITEKSVFDQADWWEGFKKELDAISRKLKC